MNMLNAIKATINYIIEAITKKHFRGCFFMFGFFKKQSIFEKYYRLFLSHPAINGRKHCQEVTAAYLFVVSDFLLLSRGENAKRQENAQNIFNLLEKEILTNAQLTRFDKVVDLFGAVLRGNVSVRGDWCSLDKEISDGLQRVFLCYGDLIYAPNYIEDYQNSPILLAGADSIVSFCLKFMEIQQLTGNYLSQI